MRVYEPDGASVTLQLEDGQAMEVEFKDEDTAILFFEFMKEATIAEEK